MTLENQETLLDTERSGHAQIETDGRIIRPILAVPLALVDEGRIHADADGLHIKVVGAANVGMVEMDVYTRAFDAYDLQAADEEIVVGADFTGIKDMVADARMRVNDPDPVDLSLGTELVRSEITRKYGTSKVTRTDETLTIDPDSIRGEPDLPDLELPYRATMDARAFVDVVQYFDDAGYEAVRINAYQKNASDELGLKFGGKVDDIAVRASEAHFDVDMEREADSPPAVLGSYSIDYISDVATGIKNAKADTVTIRMGDDFPVSVGFERKNDDGKTLYEGEYMVAPQIRDEE